MGRRPKDYDVATAARPEQVQALFKRVIPTGVQHGTVTVLTSIGPVEVTTFRTEGAYLDGRRPDSVKFHDDLETDLSRRDFTINAIALDPTNNSLRDPFGGQKDLLARIVRSVGRAEDRFSEDGLRPLRAIRIATMLDFQIEPNTWNAIPCSLETFRRISVERIREEFNKILISSRASAGLRQLHATGLFEVFLPEVARTSGVSLPPPHRFDTFDHGLATVDGLSGNLELRLAALFHDVSHRERDEGPRAHATRGAAIAEAALTRLKYPTKTIEHIKSLVAEHALDEIREWSPAEIRRLAARVGETLLHELLLLTQANRSARGPDEQAALQRLGELESKVKAVLSEGPPLSVKALGIGGQEIMKILCIGPSPLVGEATRFLMDIVLEEPKANTPGELARLLQAWARAKAR